MANDCWNKAIIRGDETTLKKIEEKFNSSEGGVFTLSNYKTLFETNVSDMEEDDWGSKRFTPNTDWNDKDLIVTGDSAWSPMIGLFELISSEYEVECELEFEERGYDFAGKLVWDIYGGIKESYEWSYWEKLYLDDQENFWEEVSWNMEGYDDWEEFLEMMEFSNWKLNKFDEYDKMKQIWESKQDED